MSDLRPQDETMLTRLGCILVALTFSGIVAIAFFGAAICRYLFKHL